MNEQLQKEIFEKVSIRWDAMTTKLGIAGQYAFEAAVRWHMAGAIVSILEATAIIIVCYRFIPKLLTWAVSKGDNDWCDVWSSERTLGKFLLVFLAVIVAMHGFCTLQNGVRTVIAPEYAVIQDVISMVK